MQLLSALDQMAGTLWIGIHVSGVLVCCGFAVYATGALAARWARCGAWRPSLRQWFRKFG
jgi:hypothetical protein